MDAAKLVQFVVYFVVDQRLVVVRRVITNYVEHGVGIQLVHHLHTVKVDHHSTAENRSQKFTKFNTFNEAGWSTNYIHKIFLKYLDMICLLINFYLQKINPYTGTVNSLYYACT